MQKLSLAILLFAVTAFAGETVKRGAAIAPDAKAIPVARVLEQPEAFATDPVVTEGLITTVCARKGCWMQLGDLRVTFKDYQFFVPVDSEGMKARISGVTVVKTYSKADADHLEEEGAKLTRREDGTAVEVSFVADGLELTQE